MIGELQLAHLLDDAEDENACLHPLDDTEDENACLQRMLGGEEEGHTSCSQREQG